MWRIKEMAKLTFYSKVSGKEATLLLRALKNFIQTDAPTVIISNRELKEFLGDAKGGDIYGVLNAFSHEVLSVEDQAYERFAVYALVESIGWEDGTLFVHFNMSARQFIKQWMEYYQNRSLGTTMIR